jgi:probable rRNA maturation factor
MPLVIKINNLNSKRKVPKRAVRAAALRILDRFKVKHALIDITFVDDKRMKALNKKYKRKCESTDVLSFLLRAETLIGDIYISSDMARRNAARFKTDFGREATLYVIHGMLHLFGFGDKTKEEQKRIRALEARFLNG